MTPTLRIRTRLRRISTVSVALGMLCSTLCANAQDSFAPGDEVEILERLQVGESVQLTAGEFREAWKLSEPASVMGAGRDATMLVFPALTSTEDAAIVWTGTETLALANLAISLDATSAVGDVLRATAGLVQLETVDVIGNWIGEGAPSSSSTGLRFVDVAEGLVRGSSVTRNSGAGVIVSGKSIVTIELSGLSNNGAGGLLLEDDASLALVESVISYNNGPGVLASGRAWLTSFRTHIGNNAGP